MYTTKIQKDKNGDLFIELPKEILIEANLNEGDLVEWVLVEDGSFILNRMKETHD